jgi:hypothetical protein
MRKPVSLALCMIALASGAANAQIGTRAALGVGVVTSCGKWTELRRTRGSGNWNFAANWALGFLSSAATFSDYDILNGLDSDGVFGWLDNHCRAFPLESLPDALVAFVHVRTATH